MKIIIWPWSRDGAGLKNAEGFTTEPTLLVAAPPCSGGSLVPGPCLVPPVWDAQVVFTSRCHRWSTGRWDTHPKHDLVVFWLYKEHTQTHRQRDLELRDFSFFFYFYLFSCQQGTGERIFRLSRKWGCNFLLWNISVAVLGKEGIAGEQVQPSLFILHSALLAVKAKFTLLICVLGEWCPMQVPPLFHLNAKRSSSSRKWHVLIDLPSQSLKQKIPAAAQSQSSGWECVWPLAEAFTEALLKQGRVRLYPQLTNLHPKRHHCLQTLDSRLKGLLFGSWRAVQAQKPKVCFHLLTY